MKYFSFQYKHRDGSGFFVETTQRFPLGTRAGFEPAAPEALRVQGVPDPGGELLYPEGLLDEVRPLALDLVL